MANLPRVPEFTVVHGDLSAAVRLDAVQRFMAAHGLSYPVVLKPDIGERGAGVAIAREDRDVATYFATAAGATIVQRYVPGLEFGIFYYRVPGEPEGRIFSITEKRFPSVTGDGVSTIAELILRDPRAVCLADLYLGRLKRPAHDVPAAGEPVALAEIGSHCRGAIFLDGGALATEPLRIAIDAIARSFHGFYFGRFDVRTPSVEALQSGRFEVLELNGVSAEATHIYDPAVSVWEAYRVLFHQWRIAFEIGARNRQAGWRPMTLFEFLSLLGPRSSATTAAPDGAAAIRQPNTP